MTVRISASMIGAIMGVDPSRTRDSVLRQMVRQHHGAENEFNADNVATQYGKMHETAALLAFGHDAEKCEYRPYGDLLGARADALTNDAVVEIKVPYSRKFKEIAPAYYHQVQMEMLAYGKDKAYFVQYRPAKGDPFSDDYEPEDMQVDVIEHDPTWLESVETELSRFYDLFKSEIDNPEHLQPLRKIVDDEKAQNLIKELEATRSRMKFDKDREAQIIKDIIKHAGEVEADVCGHKLTKVERAGAIDTKKMASDNNIDAEAYRKAGSFYWKLS